jgi:hypothetical protein
MPLFSVVVPTRNRRALLEEALASVAVQSFRDFDVTVVDDGSTDGSREYLASLGDRIRTVQLDGRGPGAARNAGAQVATGTYLAFLDSDDVWLPWTLATFAEAIHRFGQPALMRASFRRFSEAAEFEAERGGDVVGEVFADYLATWPRPMPIAGGMMVVRRDEFNRVGGFTTRPVNLEDHDLVLKLGDARAFVALQSPLAMGWRLHGDNVSADPAKSVDGCLMLIEAERDGRYPGGTPRQPARRGIIATHARSVSVECARAGRARDAWRIYSAAFAWQFASRRWKYVATFPLVMSAAIFRSRRQAIPA